MGFSSPNVSCCCCLMWLHTFTVKHLHFQTALQFLLSVKQCATLFQKICLTEPTYKRSPHLSVVVYCDPTERAMKPQHTCRYSVYSINTVIHTGGYTNRTVFYSSRKGIVLRRNAAREKNPNGKVWWKVLFSIQLHSQ